MGFSANQKEYLKDNLGAYIANFGYIRLSKYDKYYYIHTDENDPDGWMYVCESIQELNGWLMGAVQGVRRLKAYDDIQNVDKSTMFDNLFI